MENYLPFEPRSPEIVDCLISEYGWLEILKKQNNPYNDLLDYLIELGKYVSLNPDENCDRESTKIKTISGKTNISPSKVRNWIFKIYDDIFDLNANYPLLFAKEGCYRHVLSFSSTYGHYSNLSIWLPLRLHLYDGFTFQFIKAKVNYYFFYVNRLSVKHGYGDTIIEANLCDGIYNMYREFVYNKAYFLDVLSLNDILNLTNYDIDKLLKEYSRTSNISHHYREQKYGRKRRYF